MLRFKVFFKVISGLNGDKQHSDRIDQIYKSIDIVEHKNNPEGHDCIRPYKKGRFINDLVNKNDDKPQADQEAGVAQQALVILYDQVIDLIDTE